MKLLSHLIMPDCQCVEFFQFSSGAHAPPGTDEPVLGQKARGTLLCVLAIPADMGIAEFCKFVGAFLPSIRTMRLVRKDGGQSVCLILLQMADQDITDEFYTEYNGRPVRDVLDLHGAIMCFSQAIFLVGAETHRG